MVNGWAGTVADLHDVGGLDLSLLDEMVAMLGVTSSTHALAALARRGI